VIPFAATDHDNIRVFAEQVDASFLPRPQGQESAIAAGARHPEISIPAAFDAYRTLLIETGCNLASPVQLAATREMTTDAALAERDGENPLVPGHTRVSIRHLYHAGLWAAIRSGWREGYNAEADHFIVSGDSSEDIARSFEHVKEAIRQAAGYTKFTTDTSRLFELEADVRHAAAWGDSAVAERFAQILTPEEQSWVAAEFSRPFSIGGREYSFTRQEIIRLSVKFGMSLKRNEELYDFIQQCKCGRSFDFEPSIDEAETLTTAKELLFYMHWLQARGRPAPLVPPNFGFKKRQPFPVMMERTAEHGVGLREYCHGKMWPELLPRVEQEFGGHPLKELAARIREHADIAHHFNATLSVHSGSGKQAAVLGIIGEATSGRVNYKISGELQLLLLDVLAEQPVDSYWRQLFDRMVDRANRFAAAGLYGPESKLAGHYAGSGGGRLLGDAARGRVDGNLFLVFWLGNVVGSRDVNSPDGDNRFFKEKIDEMPDNLLHEVRERNSRYIIWLAEHLLASPRGTGNP
jgi:hypothetical protein